MMHKWKASFFLLDISIDEFPLDFHVLDNDLLSLEMPLFFQDFYQVNTHTNTNVHTYMYIYYIVYHYLYSLPSDS